MMRFVESSMDSKPRYKLANDRFNENSASAPKSRQTDTPFDEGADVVRNRFCMGVTRYEEWGEAMKAIVQLKPESRASY
jgi:hypothetical protein